MIHEPLQILFALALVLPLGCDMAELDGGEALENPAEALELSLNQDLVEDPEILAFEQVDELDIEADVQAFASGCTLLRPAAWSGAGTTCVEYYKAPGAPADLFPMSDGQSFITYSGYSGGGLGSGHARITCNNGVISIQSLSCVPGGGVTP